MYVCMYVTRRNSIETVERIQLLFLAQGASFSLCCKRISLSSKVTALPFGTLSQRIQTLNLADLSGFISPRHVDRRKCYPFISTDDYRQFITLSVHACLQYCERDAQRRAVRLRQLRLV